jgi:gliding motility-associated-like protein
MLYKIGLIKRQFVLFSVFYFYAALLTAQQKTFTTKWSASPFDNKLFIENKGEFDGELPGNNKILFKAQVGKITMYFTPKGIVYCLHEILNAESDTRKTEEKEVSKEKPVAHYLYADWMGAEGTSVVSADEKQSYCYTYASGKNNTITTNVYKKLVYQNLYPGIDAVYIFPDKKTGIKYSLVIHPGADISKVKLEYRGANSIHQDSDGNIVISSEIGIITDHSPISYYMAGAVSLGSKYQISGTVESFYLDKGYDKNKIIVIDPWTSSTSFAGINAAFDLDYDKYGNVYAYGGEVNTSATQLVKFNSSGVKQWVFNASAVSGTISDCYGDIATDKNSGTTYILQGFNQGQVLKVSSAGLLSNTYLGSGKVNEYWRADFDECHHMIIIGAGGTSNPYQAATLDTNFTNFTPVNIAAATDNYHDISLMTLDPYSNSCFMASAGNSLDTIFGNDLCKLPLPSLSPTTFKKKDGYSFREVFSVPYAGYGGGGNDNTNAMNGAAASPSWLYLYNGDTLKQFNKTTGILYAQIAMGTTPYKCGGLDVDACDNLYVGFDKSIRVYNSSLSLQSTISLNDTVYDVHLGPQNILFACGKDFVTAISITGTKNISTTITYPSTCSACDGSATANLACGKGPFTYLWSNGSTNQTATGLCAGTYTVTVTDGVSCSPIIDTAIVNIPGKPGYTLSVIDTNATCTTTGSITAYPAGGISPYTYNWSNGETTQHDSGLAPGIYTCIITDNNGCKYTISTSLPPLVLPTLYVNPPSDSVCFGTTVSLNVSGANSYTWQPSSGLSCTNCPNPVASPTANTSYTVMGINSSGCTGKDSVIVAFSAPPVLSITSYPEGCTETYLEGFGASSYVWSPNNGLSCSICEYTTAYSYITTTYTLVGTLHGCSDSTTITVTPNSTPTVTLTASKDTICPGDSVKLTALVSGPGTMYYYWTPNTGSCKTCSSIYVKPTTTTYYNVDVIDSEGCSVFASIAIYIEGITINSNSNCIETYLSASGSSSGYTWSPSTGLSCTSCQYTVAAPSVTTTYTVYGTGASFCSGGNQAVIIVQPATTPTVTLTASKHSICAGDSVKLTAMASGSNIKYYYWYPSAVTCNTCSVVYVKPTATTKYTVEVYDSTGGCYAYDTVTISVGGIGVESISIGCGGGITYLYAAGSSSTYTWAPAAGLSCTSCQYTIATPTVTTTYTVTGTGGGSCGNSSVIKVVPFKLSTIVSIKATPDTICAGGSVSLSASGKDISSYYWSSVSGGLSCSYCQNTKAYPGGTSVYTLTVYDSLGCTFDTSITIYVAPSVTISSTAEYCYGAVDLHASGSVSYIWSPTAGLSCTSCANPFATPTVNTTYTVTGIGTSCPNGTTASIVVPARPAPSTSCCDATIPIGQSVSLTASGGGTYLWSPSAGLSCDTCANPIASPNVTTIYTITVTNDSGCASATTITVDITCGTVFVPEAFSPNGDGQNDYLYVRGDCIKTLDFMVFDRWGNIVFQTKDKSIPWNGQCRGEAMNTGSYVYYLNATFYDGTTFSKKGNVTLVR